MSEDDREQLSEGNSEPIDITRIRNGASIQRHLSVSKSLKRLRISPSWYSSFPRDRIHNSPEVGLSGQQSQRTKKTELRMFHHCETPSENPIRGGRLDRSYFKLISRFILIAYCFLSCIVATCRLYTFFRTKTHTSRVLQRPAAVNPPTMEMSVMTNYLLKALPCCATFEPFVLSNDHNDSDVSFVGWLSESEVDSIGTWNTLWPGML